MLTNKFIIFPILFLLNQSTLKNAQGQSFGNFDRSDIYQDQKIIRHSGFCPKIKGDWVSKNQGKLFELNRVMGQWKTIYDTKERIEDMECVSLKLQPFNEFNKTVLHVLSGQILTGVAGENEDDHFSPDKDTNVFYDDEIYFTFNHQSNPTLAAIQNIDEVLDHENEMSNQDPYHQSISVLDTDYDNFLMLYNCKEEMEDLNKAFQSKQDIEQLKQDKRGRLEFLQQVKQVLRNHIHENAHDIELENFLTELKQKNDQTASDDEVKIEIEKFKKLLPDIQGEVFFSGENSFQQWNELKKQIIQIDFKQPIDHNDQQETDFSDHQFIGEFDEEYELKQTHSIQLTLLVRDAEAVTDSKYEEYIQKLKEMITDHDFQASQHQRFLHNQKICPPSLIDMFTLKGAKSVQEFHSHMQDADHIHEHEHVYDEDEEHEEHEYDEHEEEDLHQQNDEDQGHNQFNDEL